MCLKVDTFIFLMGKFNADNIDCCKKTIMKSKFDNAIFIAAITVATKLF